MLQLDPAFSERDYGESSFSAFIEKLVDDGKLSLRTVEGHYVVDRGGEPTELDDEPGAVSGCTGNDVFYIQVFFEGGCKFLYCRPIDKCC
jgi:hypothetical protein